ncbi:hypothetical protein PGB90_000892 [Kerria lacca]
MHISLPKGMMFWHIMRNEKKKIPFLIDGISIATFNKKVGLNISVFYETLCRPSVRLIQRQLKPVWWELKDYLNISFVPYGKAVYNKNDDGIWSFDCHHGPQECLGNKIQACGLSILKNDSTKSMEYISCFMTYNNFYPYKTTCFEDIVDNLESKTKHEECVNSTKGDEILAYYGDLTYSVQPSITSVPALTFNGVFNYDWQHRAINDFKSVVCDFLQSLKLTACFKTNAFI